MLASDAVDRSVAQIDLTPLRGRTVYFDTQYIRSVKGAGFVNADYIISSLRQQMFAYDCRIQDNREDADIVIEGRVGVLGIDDHEITYGMPASNALNSAASAAGAQIPLPALPELSVAKKNEQIGASKVALFAYDRETRQRVWQSGVTTSMSDSDAFWVFGAGPFRRGSIYRGMHLAGSRVPLPHRKETDAAKEQDIALARYQQEDDFEEPDEPAPIITPEDANRIKKPSEQGTPATLSIADEPTPAPSLTPSTNDATDAEKSPAPQAAPDLDEPKAATAASEKEKTAKEKTAKETPPEKKPPKKTAPPKAADPAPPSETAQ